MAAPSCAQRRAVGERRQISVHKDGNHWNGSAFDHPFIDGGEGVAQLGILRVGQVEASVDQLIQQFFGQRMGGKRILAARKSGSRFLAAYDGETSEPRRGKMSPGDRCR